MRRAGLHPGALLALAALLLGGGFLTPAIPLAPAAPLAQTCAPRPRVDVAVVPGPPGRVQVTISATGTGNRLVRLRFEAATNAQVDVDGQLRAVPFTLDLPAGTLQKAFAVVQGAPGQAATVTRLVVEDGCGEWPTVVGGGVAALASPTPTRTPTPTPTATPTPVALTANVWATPDSAGAVGLYTALALDAAGNPVISYYDATNGDLKVLHCGNPTCTAPPGCGAGQNCLATPDSGGDVGQFTSLALDAAGNPVVSYYDATNGHLKVLRCGNPTCTAGNTLAIPDSTGVVGLYTALALDAAGNPVISYYDGFLNGNLKVLHCGNPTCTAPPGCGAGQNCLATPDSTGDVGPYTSLRLDAAGNPVVSYYDATNGDLKVLHCGNPTCTAPPGCGAGQNCIAIPDSAGDVGQHTSLRLDAAGNPVVSYHDATNRDLKVLHCGNPTCTALGSNCAAGQNCVTTPAFTGDVGRFTSLRLDAVGNPVVSYYDQTNGDLKLLRCGNPTCTAGNTITTPDHVGDVGRYTALALDALGRPVVSYWDETNADLRVLYCASATCPAGHTIVTVDTPDNLLGGSVGQYSSLVLDAAGNPVVSYYSEVGSLSTQLRLLRCGNPTCTAGNTIAIPDPLLLLLGQRVGGYTSLRLDAAGNPVVSYYDFGNADLKVLHCGNPTCTAGNTIATPDSTGFVGQHTALALDGAGNPVVSYHDQTNGDLKVLHCGNPTCTAGNTIATPASAGNLGAFTALALDAAGNPVVSYYDFTNGDLQVLHCGNPTCTAGNTIATPASAGDVGAYTALALDAAGNPVVSYYDFTNGDLKLLRCGNPTCTANNTIATPDSTGNVGQYTALRLDAAGNPVVSYYDATNGDLKVLHCGNPTCTTGNAIATPDSTGDVGPYTALRLDAAGNPVVSYYDTTNHALKVLRCVNPTCTGLP